MKIHLELYAPDPILVNASIAPIEFTTGGFHVDWETLATLREVEPRRNYPVSTFRGFLPTEAVAVGEYWEIDDESTLQLLKQLTENPSLQLWVNDEIGRWATLRAYNEDYAEIVYRIHAAFELTDGFFTPSLFAGTLVIDRHLKELTYFEMSVPPGTLNFDVHKVIDENRAFTDGGVCNIEMAAGEEITPNLTYTEEISADEARLGLAKQCYPAQSIEWVALEEAAEMAKALDRPIHVVSADGTFMDQSC
jgi:hypothetical protein